MTHRFAGRLSLVLAVAAALSAGPALAQGRGHDRDRKEHPKQEAKRPELRRRTDDRDRRDDRSKRDRDRSRDRDRDRDRRNDSRYDGYPLRRNVPPGWCIGRGNPHNTPENCGYGSRGRYDGYDRNDRYGTYGRSGGYDRYGTYGRSGSFDAQHREFHAYLDRKYRQMGAQHPLDPRWQVEVARQKRVEHERWHDRMGVRH